MRWIVLSVKAASLRELENPLDRCNLLRKAAVRARIGRQNGITSYES